MAPSHFCVKVRMKTITDFDVAEKRVLLRADFNVPVNSEGIILDDTRIRAALLTIRYLTDHKAKIILVGHLGEPDGYYTEELSFKRVHEKLELLLNVPVIKTSDCVGSEVESAAYSLKAGQVLLLENVRFHKEEMDNDSLFAKSLASLADIYINDAFDVCHRSHASVVGIPQYLPHGIGLLFQKEINGLGGVLKNPKRPLVVIMGGAKTSTKVHYINGFSKIADSVLIGGLLKKELDAQPQKISQPEKVLAPVGALDGFDINSETIQLFSEKISGAKTVIWNGPMGKFEEEAYKHGTLAIAKAIIASGAYSVVGGGDTIEFLQKEGILEKFSHVSTAGGAMLSYLSGEKLPGLEALI
jgi:phosphoglycerate kinase